MFLAFIIAGFGLVALAHVAPFPFVLDLLAPVDTRWKMPRNPETPTVYLTFDDGPNPTATPDLLDVLRREEAVATFFLIERHLTAETAPIVRRIVAEGHAVGLHTHTRAPMLMTPDAFARSLRTFADRLEAISGRRPCPVFRPHGGWRSAQMLEGLALADHALVGWGWGLWDFNWYRPPHVETLVDRLTRKASDGDIIVIHDGHHLDTRADRRYTVDTVARLIPALRAKGLTLGRVCAPA